MGCARRVTENVDEGGVDGNGRDVTELDGGALDALGDLAGEDAAGQEPEAVDEDHQSDCGCCGGRSHKHCRDDSIYILWKESYRGTD